MFKARLVSMYEDEFTEFKESLAQLDKGLKSVTAMLNKHGEANVYFGVSYNGDVNQVVYSREQINGILYISPRGICRSTKLSVPDNKCF